INAANVNTFTATAYGLPNTASLNLNLFASLIPLSTGSNDNTPALACRATTSDATKCSVWKADINLPSTASLAVKFKAPGTLPANQIIDTGTDVFVDEKYDVTTAIGITDPIGTSKSVHSLHE